MSPYRIACRVIQLIEDRAHDLDEKTELLSEVILEQGRGWEIAKDTIPWSMTESVIDWIYQITKEEMSE